MKGNRWIEGAHQPESTNTTAERQSCTSKVVLGAGRFSWMCSSEKMCSIYIAAVLGL